MLLPLAKRQTPKSKINDLFSSITFHSLSIYSSTTFCTINECSNQNAFEWLKNAIKKPEKLIFYGDETLIFSATGLYIWRKTTFLHRRSFRFPFHRHRRSRSNHDKSTSIIPAAQQSCCITQSDIFMDHENATLFCCSFTNNPSIQSWHTYNTFWPWETFRICLEIPKQDDFPHSLTYKSRCSRCD